jgi:hypothetical protein
MEQDDEVPKLDEKDESIPDLLDSIAFALIDDISRSKKVIGMNHIEFFK